MSNKSARMTDNEVDKEKTTIVISDDEFNNKYIIGSNIGQKHNVYKGYDKMLDRYVVFKIFEIYQSIADSGVLTELNIMKIIYEFETKCNKYITCYYDSYETLVNGKSSIIIISEYIDGITIGKYISDLADMPIRPEKLWIIIYQLINGLCYMHSLDISHSDIHAENIMIDKCMGTIKYIDFGLSCLKVCQWNRELSDAKLDDIMQIGILLYQMANGVHPQSKPSQYYGSKFYNTKLNIGDDVINQIIDDLTFNYQDVGLNKYNNYITKIIIANFGNLDPNIIL